MRPDKSLARGGGSLPHPEAGVAVFAAEDLHVGPLRVWLVFPFVKAQLATLRPPPFNKLLEESDDGQDHRPSTLDEQGTPNDSRTSSGSIGWDRLCGAAAYTAAPQSGSGFPSRHRN